MSERFERWNDHSCKVKDNQEDTLLNWEDVVDLLNEQQATISALKEENEQLMIENAKLKNVITELKDINIYSKRTPENVCVFVKRINCYQNGIQKVYSSAVCYCWLIFDNKSPTDDTKLIWLI